MFQLRLVLLFVFGVVFKTQAKEAHLDSTNVLGAVQIAHS